MTASTTTYAPGRRGSVRSRAAATLSYLTLRQLSSVLPPERAWALRLSRRIVAGVMDVLGPSLTDVAVDQVDDTLPDGRRVVGEWVSANGVQADTGAIYFLHGSGYAICSPRTHRRLTGWLSKLTGLPVFCVDYRLAPDHPFPAAADDVHAGWEWLRRSGLSQDRIVIAGDSAGGHLAVDLMLHGENTPRPAAVVLFSPLVDLTFTLARQREQLRPDPAIRAADAARLVRLYCTGTDPAHPRLVHDLADSSELPPMLIQAGGAEMLAADAHHLARAIRATGGSCELQVWPDQVHVFQALPRSSPEAAEAMQYAAQLSLTHSASLPATRKQVEHIVFGFGTRRTRDGNAVVTGAGSGIGAAFALELAERGNRVVCSDIDDDAAQRTVDAITDQGGTAVAPHCDVSRIDNVNDLAHQAQTYFDDAPTLVVNNAGVGAGGQPVGDIPIDDWEWTLGINLWGPIHGCHVFTPILREAQRSQRPRGIINVASAASFGAAPGMAAYNVSKAAVLSLSETLAAELSGTDIGVTVLCPTFVKTNIVSSGRITANSTELAGKLMRWTGFSPARVARMCLDTHDRGGLYCMPQPDARIGWGVKRLAPTTYTRTVGLVSRLGTITH